MVPLNGSRVKVPNVEKFSNFFKELFGPMVNCGAKHPVVLTTFVIQKHPRVSIYYFGTDCPAWYLFAQKTNRTITLSSPSVLRDQYRFWRPYQYVDCTHHRNHQGNIHIYTSIEYPPLLTLVFTFRLWTHATFQYHPCLAWVSDILKFMTLSRIHPKMLHIWNSYNYYPFLSTLWQAQCLVASLH